MIADCRVTFTAPESFGNESQLGLFAQKYAFPEHGRS